MAATPLQKLEAHDHDHHGPVHHQFEDIEQQNDTYLIGMWSFLAQEIMFFGGLFACYIIYRWKYGFDWQMAHQELSVFWGGLNTANLLLSSFFMVMAVHNAQLKKRMNVLKWLGAVQACAVGFLAIKYIEYSGKFEHKLFPGVNFRPELEHLHGANPNAAQIFYGLYFAMTGLHGLHIIVGILLIGALMAYWYKKNRLVTEDFMPTEMVGLYWHFVDLVWIFLFPLFYLMPTVHHH